MTSTDTNIQIPYDEPGEIEIELIASNDCNLDTKTQSISVTNTSDYSITEEIKVSPNPFINEISIKTELNDYTIKIYDANGRFLKQVSNMKSGNQKVELKDLSKGLYNVHFIKDAKISVKTIVKQ